MATKKTTTKKVPAKKAPAKKAAAPKKEPKAKKEPVKVGPRHPRARVQASSGSKAELAKALAPALVRGDEDAGTVEARLKTASNTQLLRLQRVVDTVKAKYGSRAGVIEAIGKSQHKSKDKDYLAKLETLPLPNLLDLATSAERRARA